MRVHDRKYKPEPGCLDDLLPEKQLWAGQFSRSSHYKKTILWEITGLNKKVA